MKKKNDTDLDDESDDTPEPWYKGPITTILALFLILIIIMMVIPYYSVALDPAPKNIPELKDVFTSNSIPENNLKLNNRADMRKFITPNDPIIKQTADKIALSSCDSYHKVCYAKALFYFSRDKIQYINDPPDEYVKMSTETLVTGGGDCDDKSVLLSSMLEAVGIPTRFVFVPGHVYVQAFIQEALSKYKDDGWINLDPACLSCDFGEISISSSEKNKDIVR